MKHALIAGAALAAGLITPFAASAAVTIVGRGPAADCYEAANTGRRDRSALDFCDLALSGDLMTTEDRVATFVNRAIIHLRRGDGDRALRDLDTAISLDSTLVEAHVVRGAALVAVGRYQDAVDALTRTLALNPSHPERAYFHRAAAYEELGDLRAAYRDYRRAAELAPDWNAPQIELSRFQVRG